MFINGLGITSSIGQGKAKFTDNLFAGNSAFGILDQAGRSNSNLRFVGAEIPTLCVPARFDVPEFQQLTRIQQIALVTLEEAWNDASIDEQEPERVGLFVSGSNFNQRELHTTLAQYATRPFFLDPAYAMKFMDTDMIGLCSQYFPIRGASCSIGGASASGQVAIIQALQNLKSGLLDTAIVLAPVMDLSLWECQAFRSIGAMGTDRFVDRPQSASRPFDANRDGFIFGESCGVLVLQRDPKNTSASYAEITGYAATMDGNRKPHSSVAGELKVIRDALAMAELKPEQIDYINPHGSGSISGDEVELEALRQSGLTQASLNTTKSIIGHGLSAAGLVEVIATIVQMQSRCLHPSRNLEQPIDGDFAWVGDGCLEKKINHALTLSYGFGGFNTAICLRDCH